VKPLLGRRSQDNSRAVWKLSDENKRFLRRIKDAIAHGELSLEQTDCPLCASADFDPVAEKDRYGIPVTTVLCRQCGFVYRRRRMAMNCAARFYNDYYKGLFKGKVDPERYFANQQSHGLFIYDFVREFLPRGGFVVEYGCGPGGILSVFRDKGFEVCGYDLDESYSQYQIAGKPEIITGGLDRLSHIERTADVIILSHVLEHTYQPEEVLRECRRILTDGGILYIEVPGLRNFHQGHYSLCGCLESHPYRMDLLKEIVLAHNFEFDLDTLGFFLRRSGFEVLRSTELIRTVSRKSKSPELKIEEMLRDNYRRNKQYLDDLERSRKRYRAKAIFQFAFERLLGRA